MRAGLLALALVPGAKAFWPFKQKRFTSETLLDAGSLGLDPNVGRIAAVGDVNGDQNSDLFSIAPDRKSVQAWLWNRDQWRYDAGPVLDFEKLVYNVVPADFNGDGRLDLLVMTGEEDKWWEKSDKRLFLTVVLGNETGFGERWELETSGRYQPFVFDDEHNLLPSLLGYLPDGERENNLRSWKNVDGSRLTIGRPSLFPIDSGCTLATPHSSAYVDLDGDCAPDVVLHCQSNKANNRKLQVYSNRGTNGYVITNTIDLPMYSRAVTFADMNRDGAVDLVFATCKRHKLSSGLGEECSINIAYNQQAPVCSGEATQWEKDGRLRCRGWGELCVADPTWGFDYSEHTGTFLNVDLEELFPKQNVQLMLTVPGNQGHIPLPLRPGDFDVDGFPDLLVTVKTDKGTQVKILKNVPCGKGVAGCAGQPKGTRGFVVGQGKGYEALEAITDAEGASWLDLDDDGSLDILVQRSGRQKGGPHGARATFIQNNFYHDAFFLKAQVLNGACDGMCTPADGGVKYSALGASYSGATFKFTVFDTGGTRHAQQVPQLPQVAHHALYSPHTYIGLGRTNNYVENLVVGTSLLPPGNTHQLESLIPNSQVIVNPPWALAPSANQLIEGRATEWRSELFLHPGDWIPWVAAAVFGTVLFLGMVVVWLNDREKKEDERERRRALHAINFQAL